MFENLSPPYTTIVADPPWPYETRVKGTRALPAQKVKDGSRLMRPVSDWTYEPMSMDDLKAMPVPSLVEKNAHLWLWTTNAFMAEAHDLARIWGFHPKTILTWGKIKKGTEEEPVPSMKTGYYLRGATEHCILATKGSLPKPERAISTLLLTPRIAQHSRKPDEFFEVVETVSPGPYLELFSRQEREGWTTWGDQLQVPKS